MEGSGSEGESRLQKWLAAAGVGSRRDIEDLIRAGRVTVNGALAGLGMRVGPQDVICLDGQPCAQPMANAAGTRVIGIHKPADVVCTTDDPDGRATIFELLPPTARRWVMVGRLDLTTSGLVLFTDDGELAHRLTHPSYEIPRRYAVRVLGTPTAEDLRAMQRGVEVDGEQLKFDRVVAAGGDGANRWFDCTLHTGRNREVRRLWEAHGFAVSRLMRTSYGPLALPREVRPGGWFEVSGDALIRLYEAVALASPIEERERLSGDRLRVSAGRRKVAPTRADAGTPAPPRRKQRAQDRTARVDYVAPGARRPRGRGETAGDEVSPRERQATRGRRGQLAPRQDEAPAAYVPSLRRDRPPPGRAAGRAGGAHPEGAAPARGRFRSQEQAQSRGVRGEASSAGPRAGARAGSTRHGARNQRSAGDERAWRPRQEPSSAGRRADSRAESIRDGARSQRSAGDERAWRPREEPSSAGRRAGSRPRTTRDGERAQRPGDARARGGPWGQPRAIGAGGPGAARYGRTQELSDRDSSRGDRRAAPWNESRSRPAGPGARQGGRTDSRRPWDPRAAESSQPRPGSRSVERPGGPPSARPGGARGARTPWREGPGESPTPRSGPRPEGGARRSPGQKPGRVARAGEARTPAGVARGARPPAGSPRSGPRGGGPPRSGGKRPPGQPRGRPSN